MITPRTKKPSRRHDWSEANRHNPEKTKRYCRHCGVVKVETGDAKEFWRDGELISTGRSPVCEPAHPQGAPSIEARDENAGPWSLVYLLLQRGVSAEKWPADMPVGGAILSHVIERFELKPGEAALSIDELIMLYPRTRRDEPPVEPARVPPTPKPASQGAGATVEAAE